MTLAAAVSASALTGCSAPETAAPASSAPAPAPASATATPSASSGPWGDFPSAAEACKTISEQATGASLLPMSAAQGKTAELEQYKAELSRRIATVKATPRAAGVSEIRIPGERSYRTREKLRQDGIEIDRKIYDALARLAQGHLDHGG